MTTLTDLRCYDRRKLMSIAAGGGPRCKEEHDVVYCPECNCTKSGDVHEPNPRTEACDAYDCPCHTEGVLLCPNCGSPDVREVVRYGERRGTEQEYFVDRACLDCSWRDIDTEGGI